MMDESFFSKRPRGALLRRGSGKPDGLPFPSLRPVPDTQVITLGVAIETLLLPSGNSTVACSALYASISFCLLAFAEALVLVSNS